MSMESMEFEELKFNPNYEIAKEVYPYVIRKKGTTRPIAISHDDKGYEQIHLNRKTYKLHKVIAAQYLDNPDNLPQIDHRSKIRDDNRVSNLRWVTKSDNDKNKTRYGGYDAIYVGELTDDAIVVDSYGTHELEFYYFDNDKFYYYNGVAYRELHVGEDKRSGALYVYAIDTNNKRTKIYLNKFKRDYDLV